MVFLSIRSGELTNIKTFIPKPSFLAIAAAFGGRDYEQILKHTIANNVSIINSIAHILAFSLFFQIKFSFWLYVVVRVL